MIAVRFTAIFFKAADEAAGVFSFIGQAAFLWLLQPTGPGENPGLFAYSMFIVASRHAGRKPYFWRAARGT